MQGFQGFSLEFVEGDVLLKPRGVLGVSIEVPELNFAVKVVDEAGTPIPNINIQVSAGGEVQDGKTKSNGLDIFSVNNNGFVQVWADNGNVVEVEFVLSEMDGHILVVEYIQGGEPSIADHPSNDFSFIRLYECHQLFYPFHSMPKLYSEKGLGERKYLPNGYIIDHCPFYAPVLVPSEETVYYLAIHLESLPSDFPDWQIRLINEKFETVATGFAELSFVESSRGIDLILSITSLLASDGIYRLMIFNNQTLEVKYLTNYVEVINSGAHDYTMYVKYRNSKFLYFYPYDFPQLSDFYQKVRIHLNQVGQFYENDEKRYRSATTGRDRRVVSISDRVIEIEAKDFDNEAHEACAVMLQHDELWINGKEYSPHSDYDIETIEDFKLSSAKFRVVDVEFSRTNKYCRKPF
jgi:hypothetical protein